MEIPIGIPMEIGMGWYEPEDCDESPWACGNSVGILNGCAIKRKRVKYAISLNVIVAV